jgi:(p)ppGpp synthase/HD superfamily hydrolase
MFEDWVPTDRRHLSPRFSEALVVASELHAGQLRKGSPVPYIAHLMGVTAIALEHGADEDEAIAALLHDAIEDAPRSLGAAGVRRVISERFGDRVLAIVEGCTDADTTPKPPWRLRKERYVDHLRTADPSTLLVSAADKLHNVRTILRDHHLEGDRVFERFSPDAGKHGTIGYYRGLADLFVGRRDVAGERFAGLVDLLAETVDELEARTGVRGRWPTSDD